MLEFGKFVQRKAAEPSNYTIVIVFWGSMDMQLNTRQGCLKSDCWDLLLAGRKTTKNIPVALGRGSVWSDLKE